MTLNIPISEPLVQQFQIRPMHTRDVTSVVRVHTSSFANFFLTFLGPSFLKELYSGTIIDPSSIAIVADSDRTVDGFVTGTVAPAGFYRRLIRKRWWRFGLASVIPLIRRPTIAPRLLRAFAMPNQTANKQFCATLMSIAVDPNIQCKGIGRTLVLAFLRESSRRGIKQVDLTTDAVNNDAVNHFYANLGFVCNREFITPEGRQMREWVYLLE